MELFAIPTTLRDLILFETCTSEQFFKLENRITALGLVELVLKQII